MCNVHRNTNTLRKKLKRGEAFSEVEWSPIRGFCPNVPRVRQAAVCTCSPENWYFKPTQAMFSSRGEEYEELGLYCLFWRLDSCWELVYFWGFLTFPPPSSDLEHAQRVTYRAKNIWQFCHFVLAVRCFHRSIFFGALQTGPLSGPWASLFTSLDLPDRSIAERSLLSRWGNFLQCWLNPALSLYICTLTVSLFLWT